MDFLRWGFSHGAKKLQPPKMPNKTQLSRAAFVALNIWIPAASLFRENSVLKKVSALVDGNNEPYLSGVKQTAH